MFQVPELTGDEVRKLAWYQGTQQQQIVGEIRKMAGISEDFMLVILDGDDVTTVLSDMIDFDTVYKIKLMVNPTVLKNDSMAYSPSTFKGSLLTTPYQTEHR